MKQILLSLLILLLVAACDQETESNVEGQAVAESETGPSATEASTLQEITPTLNEPQATATELSPTATPMPATPTVLSPTPTKSPVPTEPPPTATPEVLLPPPESFDEAPNWLAGVVADEVEVSVSQRALLDAGYLFDEADWQEVDLSGDGLKEWVVMVLDPTAEKMSASGPPGVVLIVDRSTGEVSYHTGSDPSLVPELLQVEDFTGDGVMDLLYQYQTCGAHTCHNEFYILSYHDSIIAQPLLTHGEFNAPVSMDSASWQVEDRTEDGISDLILEGGLIGSAGAGPQRGQMAVYAWNGRRIALTEAAYATTNVRYFRLLDANDAFILGNSERAIALYEEAATSNELQDSNSSNQGNEEGAIKRFAGFRLLLIYLQRNEIEPAQQWLNWLWAQYPNHAIAQAAQLLYDEYMQSKAILLTCPVVREYVQSIPDITVPLDDMGYANPALTGETLCPY